HPQSVPVSVRTGTLCGPVPGPDDAPARAGRVRASPGAGGERLAMDAAAGDDALCAGGPGGPERGAVLPSHLSAAAPGTGCVGRGARGPGAFLRGARTLPAAVPPVRRRLPGPRVR